MTSPALPSETYPMIESTAPVNATSATLSSTSLKGEVSSGTPEDPHSIIKATVDTLSGPSTTDVPIQHDDTVPLSEPSVSTMVPASSNINSKQGNGYADKNVGHKPVAKDTDNTYSSDTGEITESVPTHTKTMVPASKGQVDPALKLEPSISTIPPTTMLVTSENEDGGPVDGKNDATKWIMQQVQNTQEYNLEMSTVGSSNSTGSTYTTPLPAVDVVTGLTTNTPVITTASTATTQQTLANSNSNQVDGDPGMHKSPTPSVEDSEKAPSSVTRTIPDSSNREEGNDDPGMNISPTPSVKDSDETTTQQTLANSNSNQVDGDPGMNISPTPSIKDLYEATTQQTLANSNSNQVDGDPGMNISPTPSIKDSFEATTQQTLANSNSSQVGGDPGMNISPTPSVKDSDKPSSPGTIPDSSNSEEDDMGESTALHTV